MKEQVLARMTNILAHRGPDGAGLHVDGPVGLGHRRLSIIDLSLGGQPMGSDDGAVWITYNGEVYNYRELRQELTARGAAFRTGSDTEVILRGYEAWGVGVLERLRGMFAFAIWDARRRQMLLARDRLGVKPLVYAWDGVCLRFASEIKALLQDPDVPRDLDGEALRDYLAHLFVPAPRTIFRAIRKLPPASYLVCRLDGGEPEVHRYWTLRPAPDPAVTEAEWVRRLDHM
ncbi:MAG: asparagine synthetase B family protein, partial [Candidatus Rokuibacteriota bacterium]